MDGDVVGDGVVVDGFGCALAVVTGEGVILRGVVGLVAVVIVVVVIAVVVCTFLAAACNSAINFVF